ncbi:MAG TPA: hypothetical protein VNL94_01530 [Candidatus Binatia bacterium]|nr:hypothetical protein [Candidatus Binatia bacterium]
MSRIRHPDGEPTEVEALITDRYLDSLLSAVPAADRADRADRAGEPLDDPDASVSAAVRAISRRLATDLPRFHPSFRFEERLALRLAEVAASMRLPLAAGGEGQSAPAPAPAPIARIPIAPADPLGAAGEGDGERDARPYLIGGAVAASAISIAGAWLAWRRRTSPMARAIRAAHQIRLPGGGA